jgi:hypothetical protein
MIRGGPQVKPHPSVTNTAGPPGIVGTVAGFLACVTARTLNRLFADPLPQNWLADLMRLWGAGTWPIERLTYGEFTAYGGGLGFTAGLLWFLIS